MPLRIALFASARLGRIRGFRPGYAPTGHAAAGASRSAARNTARDAAGAASRDATATDHFGQGRLVGGAGLAFGCCGTASTALTVPARPARNSASRPVPRALARLNAAMAQRLPGITRSPVPVLLPFDTEALMRDLAAGTAADGNERYLAGFQASKFFYPGPVRL